MPVLHHSKSQPQGPAFQPVDAPVAAPVAAPEPISAAKASKAAKAPAKAAGPEKQPILLKDGSKGQCQVMMGSKQCSNPANYPWTNGRTTCRTHLKGLQKGKALKFTAKVQAYDLSLWQ